MKLVDLKCQNCGGTLRKDDENYVCDSCGCVFAVDYDESDVEYERIKTDEERERRDFEREKEERESASQSGQTGGKRINSSRSSIFLWLIPVIILVGFGVAFSKATSDSSGYGSNKSSSGYSTPTPTPAPDYNVTPDDIAGQLNDFISAGTTVQENISECAYWDHEGAIDYYTKIDVQFVDAYLITDIPNSIPKESNRLVLIYQVTWHNDELGDQICYDAVYFEGLSVNPNGGVISRFNGQTIFRSDAAWGWAQAYSFEKYDQCYLENVTAMGGTVSAVEVTEG